MLPKFKFLVLLVLTSTILSECTSNTGSESSTYPSGLTEDSLSSLETKTKSSNHRVDSPKNTSKNENQSEYQLVIPGVSAGTIKINEDFSDVLKDLSKPDKGDAATGKAISIWYSIDDTARSSISIFSVRDMGNSPKAQVKLIRVTSAAFRTKEGIQTTAKLAAIMKVYNKLNKVGDCIIAGKKYSMYDTFEGIAFEISPNDECVSIVICESGKSNPGILSVSDFRKALSDIE